MADKGKELVKQEEVLSVLKKIYPSPCKLIDYSVGPCTTSVQGFLSNMLRVTVKVELISGKKEETKFVIKRMPVLENQQKFAIEFGVFEHEIAYFMHCAPIMWQKNPNLPAVKCHMTNLVENIIYMEDLKELGFKAIVSNMSDLKEDVLTMDQIEMVMKTLAEFHATSLGINWVEKFPHIFTQDILFERGVFKDIIKQSVTNSVLPIVEHQFPNNESYLESTKWLLSEDFYNHMIALSKPDPDAVNVLCHGDSWANNMMFKIDPKTGKTLGIKLIDFQICRYAPVSRDLLYFIYMCTTGKFREEHEKEILEFYVQAFNENCSKLGHSTRLEWDKFYEEYDKSRAFGLVMAAAFRPMVFVKGVLPTENEALTEDNFDQMMGGGPGPSAAIEAFERDELFREDVIGVTKEVNTAYKKYCNLKKAT